MSPTTIPLLATTSAYALREMLPYSCLNTDVY